MLERLISSQNMAAVRLDSDLPTLVDLLPKQAKVRRRVLQAVERLVGPRRNELVHFQPRDLAAADRTGSRLHRQRLARVEPVGIVHLRAAVSRPGDPHDPPRRPLRAIWRSTSPNWKSARRPNSRSSTRMVRFALSGVVPAAGNSALFRRERRPELRPLRQLPARAAPPGGQAAPPPSRANGQPGGGRRRRGRGRGGADSPKRRCPHPGPFPLRQEPHRPDALRLGVRPA